jgi:hypothetical protein
VICGLSLRIQRSSRIVNNTISRPKKILGAFIIAPLLGEVLHQTEWADHSLAETPKMEELQMDWLRSEDLKEEKNVTAPVIIIAVCGDYRALSVIISSTAFLAKIQVNDGNSPMFVRAKSGGSEWGSNPPVTGLPAARRF